MILGRDFVKAYIKKIAYYLPEMVEENPPNRLRKKTGIFRRHICGSKEIASDLAIKAVEKIFANGIDKSCCFVLSHLIIFCLPRLAFCNTSWA